jgi:hypothetical protein
MTLFTISTLPFSAASDWSSFSPRRPALSRVFVFPVLPLALVPPVMVYLAGTHRPEMFPQELAGDSWVGLAVLFFLAEVATVLSMAWLIKHVSQSNRLAVDDYAAYLIRHSLRCRCGFRRWACSFRICSSRRQSRRGHSHSCAVPSITG